MAQINNYLEKCVAEYAASRNIENIRTAVIGIISADPAFVSGKYEAAVDYVKSKGIPMGVLFQNLDETNFPAIDRDESMWDKSYFAKASIYSENNFSEKRIEHLRQVGRKVFSSPKSAMPSNSNQAIVNGGQPKNAQSRQSIGKNQSAFPVWAVVGLAAAVVVIFLVTRII